MRRLAGCAIIDVLVVVTALGGLSWVYSRSRPNPTEAALSATRWPLAGFSENDVRVEIALEKDAAQQSLLVYPEGQVSLRMRVARAEGRARQASELSVTYMACSDDTCLTPVIGKHISVWLPSL